MRRTVLACITIVAALLFPACAHAAQPAYSVDKLDSSVYVETTSTIHLIERKTITFSGNNEGLVWYLYRPGNHESVRIDSVRFAPVDESGAIVDEWTELSRIDSDAATQGATPGDTAQAQLRGPETRPWYSFSILDGMVRTWFPAEGGTFVIETDCAILGPVQAWRDTGELTWRYAHASSPVDQRDVTLHVALPVPAESVVVPGSTVEAWGHGPADGSVVVGEDGSITCHVDCVPSGQYAECHAIFPLAWLQNMSASAPQRHSEVRRADVIAEEAEWVDVYMRESMWDNKVRVLFCGIAAVAILVCAIAMIRFGKSERSRVALLRLAAVLAVIAIAEQAFFKEPMTMYILLGLALAAGVAYITFRGTGQEAEAFGAEELLDAEGDKDYGKNADELPEGQPCVDRDARSGEINTGSSACEDSE